MVLNYTGDDQRNTPVTLVASELELRICCLLPAMHAISGCNSVSSFSHTGKTTTFQTLKNKLRWIPLTLFKKFVCYYFNSLCMLLYDVNKSGSSVNELWYRMFTKNNLSEDRLSPTLNALALHLRRASIFFPQELFFFIYQNIKYNIGKNFLLFLYPRFIKQVFFLRYTKVSKCFSVKLSFIIHLWHWTKTMLFIIIILKAQRRKLNIKKYFC